MRGPRRGSTLLRGKKTAKKERGDSLRREKRKINIWRSCPIRLPNTRREGREGLQEGIL